MVRSAFSVLLASFLVVQTAPLSAQTPAPNLELHPNTPDTQEKEQEKEQTASEFTELPSLLSSGDTIFVTDQSGRRTKGKVQEISPDVLGLMTNGQPVRLYRDDVREIELQYSDSLWSGLLIGTGVGVGLAGVVLASCSGSNCSDAAAPVLFLVGMGAGVGVAIDALRKDKRLIYTSREMASWEIRAMPILTRARKGVLVTIAF